MAVGGAVGTSVGTDAAVGAVACWGAAPAQAHASNPTRAATVSVRGTARRANGRDSNRQYARQQEVGSSTRLPHKPQPTGTLKVHVVEAGPDVAAASATATEPVNPGVTSVDSHVPQALRLANSGFDLPHQMLPGGNADKGQDWCRQTRFDHPSAATHGGPVPRKPAPYAPRDPDGLSALAVNVDRASRLDGTSWRSRPALLVRRRSGEDGRRSLGTTQVSTDTLRSSVLSAERFVRSCEKSGDDANNSCHRRVVLRSKFRCKYRN